MARLSLETAIRFLKGVGERREEAFRRLGVATVEDFLYHVPRRYLDATRVTPVARVRVGDDVTCVGVVEATRVLPTRAGLRIFHAVLRDDSGRLECAWPGQAFLERQIRAGQRLLVSGPVRHYHGRQLAPREFVILDDGDEGSASGSGGSPGAAARPEGGSRAPEGRAGVVVPIYPATEGLSHRQIRRLAEQHVSNLLSLVVDPLDDTLRAELPDLASALGGLHQPSSLDEAEVGRRRLAFDELLEQQLVFARARALAKRPRSGIAFGLKRTLTTELRKVLPFSLTTGQRASVREIVADMTASERMHRLLLGDVGSGKTVVALFAMLLAAENGYQAALMAPTELLAEQHAATLTRLLAPLGIRPELLIGRLGSAERRAALVRVGDGGARLVVGTHALIQEDVAFRRLGLVVIDEQHRFGVEQRATLIEKGEAPDVLLLSATPIPRSLALARFGDLDVTILHGRPAGRQPVRTAVRTEQAREGVYAFLEQECRAGRQGYVVYPVIEESERADLRAATTAHAQLTERFSGLTVGIVHGRQPSEERERTMRAFRDGEVALLVATTVIEVGIDVPNATVMVIEHGERFGLAQLHQLRGRVGRGHDASHCILLAPHGPGRERLRAFAATEDGFRIAELDLAERGFGELAGTRQSGAPDLKFVDLVRDLDLLERARAVAARVIARDPGLTAPEHRAIRERLLRRHARAVELFRVG